MAAKDFGMFYNKISINDNFGNEPNKYGKEYASSIYVIEIYGSTYYTYTIPNIGDYKSCTFPNQPKGHHRAALIHTHGGYTVGTDGERFSKTDRNTSGKADGVGKPIYVVTPGGKLKKYDPESKKTSIISNNMPYDNRYSSFKYMDDEERLLHDVEVFSEKLSVLWDSIKCYFDILNDTINKI